MGLHVCLTDAGFDLLSNYNGDVTVFQACVYIWDVQTLMRKYIWHFGKDRNLYSLTSSCWEVELTNQINAGNANIPQIRKHISMVTNSTFSDTTLSSSREQARTQETCLLERNAMDFGKWVHPPTLYLLSQKDENWVGAFLIRNLIYLK